jgi:DNA polymerase-3 subunit beta
MACRLIDERYPDYEGAIPTNNDKHLIVNRAEFLSSLKRLMPYTDKSNNQVRLTMKADTLHISAEDMDFSNQAQEAIIAEYEGREMEVGFNASYLIEALSTLAGDEVELTFSEPNRACIIIPREKTPEEDILMLVMPVMINSDINDQYEYEEEEEEDEFEEEEED